MCRIETGAHFHQGATLTSKALASLNETRSPGKCKTQEKTKGEKKNRYGIDLITSLSGEPEYVRHFPPTDQTKIKSPTTEFKHLGEFVTINPCSHIKRFAHRTLPVIATVTPVYTFPTPNVSVRNKKTINTLLLYQLKLFFLLSPHSFFTRGLCQHNP